MSAFTLGSTAINKLMLGETQINRAYMGSTRIWGDAPPVTAWDVSTASYASKSFSVASQDDAPTAVAFNNDGTKMYICGATNDTIYQYSLA